MRYFFNLICKQIKKLHRKNLAVSDYRKKKSLILPRKISHCGPILFFAFINELENSNFDVVDRWKPIAFLDLQRMIIT